jgi:phage I-like protein
VAIIHAAHLLDADPSALPSEFRLFALGQNATSKGTFILDAAGIQSVMSAYAEHGVDLAIDYEHQTFAAVDNGKPAPAAGWFKPEARADGLWAVNVRWTDNAAEMLRGKEYRYFSPTFEVDDKKRITRLLPLALTNFPATKNLAPLVAASAAAPTVIPTKENVPMKNFAAVIGLKDDAPEGEIEGRAVSLVGLERDLLNATGAENIGAAMAAVVSLKSIAAENETLRKTVADWQALRASEEAAEKRKTFDAVMLGCFESGKVSRKDEDQIQRMTNLFEKHGIEALNACVAGLRGRPQPVYQAAMSSNDEEQKLRDYNAYKAANPGVDPVAAAIASQRNAGGR